MQLYHGANGDNILSILKNHYIKPGDQNEVFFGRFNYRALYMHGGDIRRKASFVIAVEVDMPTEVKKQFTATSGVQDTLKVITPVHLPAKVLELFVRRQPGTKLNFRLSKSFWGKRGLVVYLPE